ncbi:hypothetical protein RISK_005325 [Rhodopirellula islandica]|uniref:DUF1257 domain-containing protein n=1 Tax=Rhodopirellula islandica TaxID=595434 RepID=A0A0J1E9W4_RHOIS|nr:hypothetical protein [Rhodopirellula islandica]KLU02259.1 hypothetical protein RISK_005325 [Rhodopirellula islandica]
MSHVVQIATQVRDAAAVRKACDRLGLDDPVEGEVKLFSQTVSGLAVQLAKWRYPVVFDLTTGESKFDNYQGHWGNQKELDPFLQAYAVEKTKLVARRKGYSVTERSLEGGNIQLSVNVGA